MTIADQARNLAISLEAKKDKLVQLQSNDWKVTFTVQNIDMDQRFTSAPMGTRYAMVLVEIGDDELPIHQPAKEKSPDSVSVKPLPESDKPPAGAKRMDWRDVQPAAQAGIRCSEIIFWAFLNDTYALNLSDKVTSADMAAEAVRAICCVHSRSELGTIHAARVLWHQLDSEYVAWKAVEHA